MYVLNCHTVLQSGDYYIMQVDKIEETIKGDWVSTVERLDFNKTSGTYVIVDHPFASSTLQS